MRRAERDRGATKLLVYLAVVMSLANDLLRAIFLRNLLDRTLDGIVEYSAVWLSGVDVIQPMVALQE